MSEKFIVDPTGNKFKDNKVIKVKEFKPYGRTIMVELLNEEEVLGTNLHVGKGASVGAPQAYVLALGNDLKEEETFIKVGDRVMLQGNGFVPVPAYDGSKRQKGIAELHHIKAVIIEDKG